MFQIQQNPPKRVGVLIAGLLGNNGSTLWCLHKLKDPILGSLITCSDVPTPQGTKNLSSLLLSQGLLSSLQDIIVIDGWDAVPNATLLEALQNNNVVPKHVIHSFLYSKYRDEMEEPIKRGIIYPTFIGLDLVENTTHNYQTDILQISQDIDSFALQHKLDFVIVMYSGCTERKANNPCKEQFDSFLKTHSVSNDNNNNWEIAPSQIYALASTTCKVETAFINCAAQDTLIPFILEKFQLVNRLAIGNDLQTGQTRLKSALLGTFLPQGIPVETIVNGNHLGNRDGKNLLHVETNRSKTTSKCSMVVGATEKAPTLYASGEKNIEQLVQISYVKNVGDNKRSMDEYICLLPFDYQLDMFINCIHPDTALAMGVMTDLILGAYVIHCTKVVSNQEATQEANKVVSHQEATQEAKNQHITNEQANALLACFIKHPQSSKTRFLLHENRDVFTGFLLEACGVLPETFRHRSLF